MNEIWRFEDFQLSVAQLCGPLVAKISVCRNVRLRILDQRKQSVNLIYLPQKRFFFKILVLRSWCKPIQLFSTHSNAHLREHFRYTTQCLPSDFGPVGSSQPPPTWTPKFQKMAQNGTFELTVISRSFLAERSLNLNKIEAEET